MEWTFLRQAARRVAAQPGFALAAVIILAIGIGANAATFSIVNGLLLRPLPYPDSEAIVSVGQALPGNTSAMLSPTELRRLQDDARTFEQLAAWSMSSFQWDGPAGPVRLFAAAVTPSLFPLLRTTPRLGRFFTEMEAVEGAQRVVLLSYDAWTDRFGSDPDVVGAPILLNDEPYTVFGVLPDGFEFPLPEIDVWTPLVVSPDEPELAGAGSSVVGVLRGVGRLRDDVSPEQAETEVGTLLDRAAAGRPRPSVFGFEARVMPVREERARPFRLAILLLAAASGLMLLMTCVSVAGLLLARGIVRQRELAIRGALGAGRGRIVCQLLTESVILSVTAGAVGLAAAVGIVRTTPAIVPGYVPGLADVAVDGVVLAFTVGISVATGLLFGTAPALVWSRVALARTLNEVGASAGGFGRLRASRGQAVLAVTQVALAVVLLTGAGVLLRDFVSLVTLDIGFEASNVVEARITDTDGPRSGVIGPDEIRARHVTARHELETLLARLERIAALPGVESVAVSSSELLNRTGAVMPFEVVGRRTATDPREQLRARILNVSPEYADAVRLRLLAGRFFTDRDRAGSPRVVVVSESFARAALGGNPALGQRLVSPSSRVASAPAVTGGGDAESNESWEVIGVMADIVSPLDLEPFAPDDGDVFMPILQTRMDEMSSLGNTPLVVVRTGGDPLAAVPFLEEALDDIRPGSLVDARVLEAMLAAHSAQPRFYVLCASIFGLVALVLAAFGLYGVLSYTVSQRRLEIGIRRALGASRGQVVRLVVAQGGMLVTAGIAIGLPAAAAAVSIADSLLFGVTADPLTFTAVTVVLVSVALLACWLPTRSAARIAPMEALRQT